MSDFIIGFVDGALPVIIGAGAYFMSYALFKNEAIRLSIGVLSCIASFILM